jgi:hypothetical protein
VQFGGPEGPRVVERDRVELRRIADPRVVVRVRVREGGAPHERVHHAVGLVLVALAELVLDHLAFAIEFVLREALHRERHAVALEPQGQLELVRGDRLLVPGVVAPRVRVEVAATLFHELRQVPALRHVP